MSKPIKYYITINGETKPLCEWARLYGIKHHTLLDRYRRGVPETLLFSKQPLDPVLKRKEHNPYSISAVECYKIGCRCLVCRIIPDDMKCRCRMKYTVRRLVKEYGAPGNEVLKYEYC